MSKPFKPVAPCEACPGGAGKPLPTTRSVIQNGYIYSGYVLEREMQTLFASQYQFVALTTEFEHDRDFVCVDCHGTSIVVQNFKGTIRAFQNVCTHRFKRVQLEDRGNSSLTCRYHGWSFDREGFLAGLPNKAQFLGEGVDVKDLSLTATRWRAAESSCS